MSNQELKDFIASLAVRQEAGIAEMEALRKSQADTERIMKEGQKEAEIQRKSVDKQLRELGQQIGGLGEKFGSFTEGMAFPSMAKLLEGKFKMDSVAPRQRKRLKDGGHMEIDVLAYANGKVNAVCAVEVKSHLREESLNQMRSLLDNFFEYFPEHKGKRLFGILAFVDARPEVEAQAAAEGIYTARISDDTFTLTTPKGFRPKYRTA